MVFHLIEDFGYDSPGSDTRTHGEFERIERQQSNLFGSFNTIDLSIYSNTSF